MVWSIKSIWELKTSDTPNKPERSVTASDILGFPGIGA
jgi:hypothetical protein